MATELPTTNGHGALDGENNYAVKAGLARMLKGGVIMDVVNAEQVRSSHSNPPTPFKFFLVASYILLDPLS
jgi:hypothetical protein